jgi:hypothetical protein
VDLVLLVVRILLNPLLTFVIGTGLVIASCRSREPTLFERVQRAERGGDEKYVEGKVQAVEGKTVGKTNAVMIASQPASGPGDWSGAVEQHLVPFAVATKDGVVQVFGPLELEGFTWSYKHGSRTTALVPGDAVAILGTPSARDRFERVVLVRAPAEWRRWLTPDEDPRRLFRWIGIGLLLVSAVQAIRWVASFRSL